MRVDLRLLLILLVVACLALLPVAALLAEEPYWMRFWSRIMMLGLAAAGLNLILGFGGLVSFGHAMYVAIGAYTVGVLRHHGVEGGLPDILVALGASAGVGLLIGVQTCALPI